MSPTILPSEWVCEVRMVEDIEEFAAELKVITLPKIPVLHHREIYIAESKVAKRVPSHRSKGAQRRRQHHAVTHDVAPKHAECGRVPSRRSSVKRHCFCGAC